MVNKKNEVSELPPEYNHNLFLFVTGYEEVYENLKDKPLDLNRVAYLKKELSRIKEYSLNFNEFIADDSLELTSYLFLKNIEYIENNYKNDNEFEQDFIEAYSFIIQQIDELINIVYEEYYDNNFHYGGKGIEPRNFSRINELIKSLLRNNIKMDKKIKELFRIP